MVTSLGAQRSVRDAALPPTPRGEELQPYHIAREGLKAEVESELAEVREHFLNITSEGSNT